MLVKKESWITCGRCGCKGLIKMCKKRKINNVLLCQSFQLTQRRSKTISKPSASVSSSLFLSPLSVCMCVFVVCVHVYVCVCCMCACVCVSECVCVCVCMCVCCKMLCTPISCWKLSTAQIPFLTFTIIMARKLLLTEKTILDSRYLAILSWPFFSADSQGVQLSSFSIDRGEPCWTRIWKTWEKLDDDANN